MKRDTALTSILAFYSLPKPSHTQHGIVRAMQTLERQGKPAYLGSIAREMGKKEGSVTQSLKDLRLKNIIRLDSFTIGDYGKDVQTYKLVYQGQNSLLG